MIERCRRRQRRTERRICPCFAMPEAMRSPPKVRYPSDLRVTRTARSMRAFGDVSNAEGPFINESVNWSSDDDSPRRRPLTGDSLRLIDEQDWRALVGGYLRYTGLMPTRRKGRS